MSSNIGRRVTDPQQWVFALFVLFGGAQIVAGIIFFFAYNWRDLPDMAKIALPQAAMVLAFLVWAGLKRDSRLGAVSGIVAAIMIGVSMAVVGQVYQLGADPWRLFMIWAALAFPIAVIMRSDAQFTLAVAIASIAYFLYADENMRPFLTQPESTIISVYVLVLFGVTLGREFLGGGAPAWLRWLFVAAALGVGVAGGTEDIFGSGTPFQDSFTASLAFIVIGVSVFAAYRLWRPDRPAQALALFAFAVFIGALGLRLIFMTDIDGAGGLSVALFLSALWVVAVTAALAVMLRRLTGRASA